MANKYKKEFHYFTLTDFEEEEIYLREKHKNGEKFVKVKVPGCYYFEPCQPEDVVYRLDFYPKAAAERENYQQMFADYGWEYLQDMNEFSYFRKKASEEDAGDMEIFSDTESRLEMVKRIFTKRMIPILVIFLLCLVPNISNVVEGTATGGVADWILFGFYVILLVWYLVLFVRCGVGFYRLKKKYSNEV